MVLLSKRLRENVRVRCQAYSTENNSLAVSMTNTFRKPVRKRFVAKQYSIYRKQPSQECPSETKVLPLARKTKKGRPLEEFDYDREHTR